MRSEGFYVNEKSTFRFVAQHLNHCATAVPMSGSKQQYIGKNVFVLFEICAYVRGSLGTCSIVIVSATLVSFSLLTVIFNSLTLKFL